MAYPVKLFELVELLFLTVPLNHPNYAVYRAAYYAAEVEKTKIEAEESESEPEPEPDIDDRPSCKNCGKPMNDGEYEDNHGLCADCAAAEE